MNRHTPFGHDRSVASKPRRTPPMTSVALLLWTITGAAPPPAASYADGCRLAGGSGRPLVVFVGRPVVDVPGCVVAKSEPRAAWWPKVGVVVSWLDEKDEHVGRKIPDGTPDGAVAAAVKAILNADGVPLPTELISATPAELLPVGPSVPWRGAPAVPFCPPGR